MEQKTELGTNRTGMDMSPIHSKKMLANSKNAFKAQKADGNGSSRSGPANGNDSISSFDKAYQKEAEPLGSVPLPGTVKGAVKSIMKMASGLSPEVFINKLGERLAFERSGVRIYEQLINKCEFGDAPAKGALRIPRENLEEFRDQEAEHFRMLVEAMQSLGADPTAQTPDADASGVASSGFMKVITDPRTTVSQSLEAMLAIELTDNAAWELLIVLAKDMGLDGMAENFQTALNQEKVHLDQVNQWYQESVRSQLN
jgi:rubrerythrin